MRLALLLLAASGCSQVFGLESPERGRDEISDAARDSAHADSADSCAARWARGPQFDTPVRIAEVSTNVYESDPVVTSDGLTMYLQRGGDILVSRRSSVSAPWATPTSEPSLNSAQAEVKFSITSDGLAGYMSSTRTGTAGGFDIFHASRPTELSPWAVDTAALVNVNQSTDEHDPFISEDGLRLYYASVTATNVQTILMAVRNDATDDFSQGVPLPGVGSGGSGNSADPTLSPDERLMVYTSTASGKRRIVYTTRSSITASFAPPIEISELNADAGMGDSDAHLTADLCTIYFSSTRTGMGDIYVATLL